MVKFAKFLCGLCVVASMCGMVWGIFMHKFLWLAIAGMVLGCFVAPFADEEEN